MDNRTNEKASITVTAKALGVSVKTIQRWVKSGKIQSIKEDNRIFIPVDEIRIRLQDKKEAVRTGRGQIEDKNINVLSIDRTHYEGLLTRLGQLESEKQYLLEYKTSLEQKEKELSETKTNLSVKNSALGDMDKELSAVKDTLSKANEALTTLVKIKQDAEQKAKALLDQRAENEQLHAEVESLKRPWWKRLFYH